MTVERRSLLKGDIVILFDPVFDLSLRNFSVRLFVLLITEDKERKVFWVFGTTFLEKVMLPVAKMFKRFLTSDIID